MATGPIIVAPVANGNLQFPKPGRKANEVTCREINFMGSPAISWELYTMGWYEIAGLLIFFFWGGTPDCYAVFGIFHDLQAFDLYPMSTDWPSS